MSCAVSPPSWLLTPDNPAPESAASLAPGGQGGWSPHPVYVLLSPSPRNLRPSWRTSWRRTPKSPVPTAQWPSGHREPATTKTPFQFLRPSSPMESVECCWPTTPSRRTSAPWAINAGSSRQLAPESSPSPSDSLRWPEWMVGDGSWAMTVRPSGWDARGCAPCCAPMTDEAPPQSSPRPSVPSSTTSSRPTCSCTPTRTRWHVSRAGRPR